MSQCWPLESLKITETNDPGVNVTKSLLQVSTKTKVVGQPNLLGEECKGISIHMEDFEPGTVIMSIPLREKRDSFLKTIGAEMKDVFWMGKEDMPATIL